MARMFLTGGLLVLLACSANRFPYDAKGLTYKNKFVYAGNSSPIKMDGYFYQVYKEKHLFVSYFFENGYYCGFGTDLTGKTACPVIDSPQRKIPYFWGVYVINNDTLKIQKIAGHGRDMYRKFMVEEWWATIADNGSTLKYFRKKDIDGKLRVVDDIYTFKHCLNKPSSDNILMQEYKK